MAGGGVGAAGQENKLVRGTCKLVFNTGTQIIDQCVFSWQTIAKTIYQHIY
jgi:hypothetical protein